VRTEEISRALEALARGEGEAEQQLIALVYEELRTMAHARRMQQGRPETLRTTDLVHESWMRLCGNGPTRWENRRHFFGAAAQAMRNVLVDNARRRSALKRDAGRKEGLEEDALEFALEEPLTDVLSLHLALEDLEKKHPRHARLASLRLFGGLSMPEIAEVMGVSLATVERDWRFGRAWLQRVMQGDAP